MYPNRFSKKRIRPSGITFTGIKKCSHTSQDSCLNGFIIVDVFSNEDAMDDAADLPVRVITNRFAAEIRLHEALEKNCCARFIISVWLIPWISERILLTRQKYVCHFQSHAI